MNCSFKINLIIKLYIGVVFSSAIVQQSSTLSILNQPINPMNSKDDHNDLHIRISQRQSLFQRPAQDHKPDPFYTSIHLNAPTLALSLKVLLAASVLPPLVEPVTFIQSSHSLAISIKTPPMTAADAMRPCPSPSNTRTSHLLIVLPSHRTFSTGTLVSLLPW
jgi:hypothetical protein